VFGKKNMATEKDLDFLKFIVESIVEHPEEMKIDRKVDEMGVLLTLKVHKDDMGQLIGRQGSTIRAVRTLLRIIGLKNHARVNLRIEEPEGGRGPAAPVERKGLDEDLNL
jgi:hypothetical protein